MLVVQQALPVKGYGKDLRYAITCQLDLQSPSQFPGVRDRAHTRQYHLKHPGIAARFGPSTRRQNLVRMQQVIVDNWTLNNYSKFISQGLLLNFIYQ